MGQENSLPNGDQPDTCGVCGHAAHKPNECSVWDLVHECICGWCNGTCSCDGVSWEFDDSLPGKKGGRFTKPEHYEEARKARAKWWREANSGERT